MGLRSCLKRIKNITINIDDLRKIRMANTPQPNIGNTAGRPAMYEGGMADMSAAPMIQPKKKKKKQLIKLKKALLQVHLE